MECEEKEFPPINRVATFNNRTEQNRMEQNRIENRREYNLGAVIGQHRTEMKSKARKVCQKERSVKLTKLCGTTARAE